MWRRLDLAITVNASIANLCGAMGRQDWILVPTAIDFRWLQGWYPTVKVFRQNYHQWEPVIAEVIEQLKVRAEDHVQRQALSIALPS